MLTAWSLVRFVHVLSAMTWVGGQLLLSLLLPILRRRLPTPTRARRVQKLGCVR
jgi:hypothetical protein